MQWVLRRWLWYVAEVENEGKIRRRKRTREEEKEIEERRQG